MSTLSGTASKGEKSKPKFQSLDINSLYKISRGENTEKPAQKSSSSYIKHGMQSLGKVPNARRAPANLPSLKSEHSDSGAAVPLVPPGATGWGKQQEQGGPPTPSTQQNGTPQNQSVSPAGQGPPQLTPHQQAIAIPTTNVIPPHNKQTLPTAAPAASSGSDKLWSAVMAGGQPDGGHPPAYQSPQFQHEFPSLSAGDGAGGTGPRGSEYAAAGPGGGQGGLSLRPQTEGSWTQGGQRAPDGSIRPVSGPQGAPPQLSVPGGRQPELLPPQMRGVLPPFMYKGSFPQGPPTGPITHPHSQAAPTAPPSGGRRNDNRPPRLQDRDMTPEELAPRPIIREEELSKLDEISQDMGWATSDDIDYNQKLAFSDDEGERPSKKDYKASVQQHHHHQSSPPQSKSQDVRSERQTPPRHWNNARSDSYRSRQSDEDDVMVQRQRHQKEVDLAIQRAKQRKEEEEKRFNEESRQRAQKKLQELDEKVRGKRDRDRESEVGTISPSTVPPKPINHVDIPLPEFQKDKEKDGRARTPNDVSTKEDNSSFRQMTQIEGKSFSRKPQQKERDNREQNGPNYSRHYQNEIPPRFLKNQQRNSGPQNQQPSNYQSYDSNRWSTNAPRAPSRGGRSDSPDRQEDDRRERGEYKRQSSDEMYRSSHHSQQDNTQKSPDARYNDDNYRRRDDDKWQKDRIDPRLQDRKMESNDRERHYDDRRSQDKPQERFDRERPQRPDSRDSHTSHTSHTSHGSHGSHGSQSSNRRSRDADLKESMGSWNEDVEAAYEEKKEKERSKEDKRPAPTLVPGPITRDRIEADDGHEKRNLTQLKKGEMPPPKKPEPLKKEDKVQSNEKLAWADSIPLEDSDKKEEAKLVEAKKPQSQDEYKDRQNRNNRSFSHSKSWGSSSSSSDFHSRGSSWANKRQPSRGHKPGGRDFYGHGTDSDGSTDTHSIDSKDSKAVPKKPIEKDDKNRENKQERSAIDQRKTQHDKVDRKDSGYVPRGEPSRHGRGGGGNFRGSRIGGLGKRIDGYGPPPSKSPFGHHEDKEKKISSEDTATETPAHPTPTTSTTDKIKQNQEALAAGIIGKSRQEPLDDKSKLSDDKNKPKPRSDNRRNKSKTRKDDLERESNSEHSDSKDGSKRPTVSRSSSQRGGQGERRGGRDRNNAPPRMVGDKRGVYDSGPSKKPENKPDPQNILASAIADISLKNRDEEEKEEKKDGSELNGDSEGFQEVKSKKTGKDRPKGPEEKKGLPLRSDSKDFKQEKKLGVPLKVNQPTTQQQIQNIPPLMSTPVNPPQDLPKPKNQYDQRSNRQNKLAPRFAKQKMQKQMQQQMMSEVGDIHKVSQNAHVYGMKDTQVPPPSTVCAWDKPLGPQLRAAEHEAAGMLGVSMEVVNLEPATPSPGHGSSPSNDKVMGKPSQISDKNVLDGSTPPVNTIIFENTNFKSVPAVRSAPRNANAATSGDKSRPKIEEGIDNAVFGKPINDLLQKSTESNGKAEPIQLPVFKEETDMKLDFFGADLTHLTDEKSSKNMISKSITSVSSTICNADSLNMKIASVKKVWETSEQETEETSGISFGGPVLDSAFKGNDGQDETHEGYSPGNSQAASTTNVCKVKPTQQVSTATGQAVSATSQQPHSAIVGHPMLLGTPLSPPPMAAAPVGVSLGPQPFATNQHLAGFQAAAGQSVAAANSAQFGISAIPSPPTVLYNSNQQLPSAALYGSFLPTADQAGVLGGQGHARAGGFSQYAAGAYHGLSQAANSYNTQSVYLPTAPHPPPTAQPPPELYPSMNSFRLSAGPFGQSQPLNNPTTVLISSTSNSLMSASVKPSSQPISAIGTKAGGVGQAYQQQSQQGQQVYMTYEPAIQAANYLPGAGVMQRGPAGPPVQNSVMPGLQPSSSYYSGSAGGQTGYYQQPGNSTLPSAPQLQQHQAGYGLQGNVFGTHNQSHTNTGLQSYQGFLSTPMQVAAAISAQQYRSAAAGLPNPYLKGVGGGGQQVTGDQQGQQAGQRPQQLKSPSSQEVLSSVFNSGELIYRYAPQIPSPKSKQNNKHTPQQSSPTSQRKYNFYQGVGNQQNNVQQRYPTPIQRPVNFQQQQNNMNSVQNSGSNQKHNRNNSNKAPNRQYYSGQSNSLPSNQNDKTEDPKVSESSTTKTGNATEISKDNIKEETPVLKD